MRKLIPIMAVIVLVSAFAAPVAAQPAEPVDECQNADEGPGDDGPPSFVGSLMPDFLGDLFSNLPVPNFVKAFFGAETC
jgi:hypothetical protein